MFPIVSIGSIQRFVAPNNRITALGLAQLWSGLYAGDRFWHRRRTEQLDTWSISPLKADVPEDVDLWSDRLYNLLPRIHLTDLLMEVDSWTGLSRYFTHLYTQQPASDRTLVFTVILSDATNIGLTKIADATPGRSYARLSWVADWYAREDNYAKALAEIVRYQHQVPLAGRYRDRVRPLLPTVRHSRLRTENRCWLTSTPSMVATR